jgi:hypothetical protein
MSSKRVQYGTTIENVDIVCDKAKSKGSGVYAFRGMLYRVSGGRVTHIAYRGTISLVVLVGMWCLRPVATCLDSETAMRKALKEI